MRHIDCCAIATAALLAGTAAGLAESPRPADFVDAASMVKPLAVELRYFTPHNFVGARVDGYEKPVCLLTRPAATALAAVAQDIAPLGLGLKVFDCYRPARAVAHFVRWAKDLNDQKEKPEFYPDVDKRDLFRLGYIADKSSHSRLDGRLDVGRAWRRPRGRHGDAVRFLQSQVLAGRRIRLKRSTRKPGPSASCHGAPRLYAIRPRMVAFHLER